MNKIKVTLILMLSLLLCLCILGGCASSGSQEDAEKPAGSEASSLPKEPDEGPSEELYDTITIAEALELCGEPGNLTTERYYIKGTVVSVDKPQYGQMTIKDETGTISVYGTYSEDGSIGYADMADKPYAGDTVILYCTLQNFNGTKEVKNARLVYFEHVEIEVNEGDYTKMTIAEARGAEAGTKVKVEGTVARITYANGQIPSGVIIVDQTQSIYLYDNDLAGRVKIGDQVSVFGSKTYWVLESEQANAEKFGYEGCCQLENIILSEIKEGTGDFNKDWITETTIKELIETPVTENITSSIYKVNALVEKREGTGYTNYYFFDLDGKTGTYTYTQCNGSDFAWLDKFDGKICTVYITALNAKSTASDCFFRFLPVDVKDEGFVFDTANAPEHAVIYYGIPQFNASYTGNPAQELVTSVSSELLGFENATISYTSSNTSVVYFEELDGKIIFNCGEPGKATVTVKGSYNGANYEKQIEVIVNNNEEYDTVTVEDAIKADIDETVTVKGIVGPSLVNQSGFYLFDESGMIAVCVDKSVFGTIEIGHEIVITGTRACKKDAEKALAGQTYIKDAEILANYYGNHSYPENNFITDKDLSYIYSLDINEDHTTEVYVIKATVVLDGNGYYTSLKLTDGTVKLTLYSSSSDQYSFLKGLVGQEVTVEIAPCNWNNKTYYTGCVLALYTQDGKIINELNFQS